MGLLASTVNKIIIIITIIHDVPDKQVNLVRCLIWVSSYL